MNKPLSLLAAALLGLSLPLLADDEGNPAVHYRQGAMHVIAWNFKPMGAMIKGSKPFEQTAFAAMAKDLAAVAALNLLAGFPEGSETDDSKALPDIWMKWDDFKAKMIDFQKAAAELAKVAAA